MTVAKLSPTFGLAYARVAAPPLPNGRIEDEPMIMKRVVSFALSGLGAALLFGCPIYPVERDQLVCVDGECFVCPDHGYSSACTEWACEDALDCPSGYTCNASHRCARAGNDRGPGAAACTKPADCPGENCGADNRCHAGDCSTSGCPSSFVCKLEGGLPACVPVGHGGGGGGRNATCRSDQDCPSPAGSKCLTGACVAPQDQCADATQCPGDAACVGGACTPTCSANDPCPTGYACDVDKGVCTGENPAPCAKSADCAGSTVCVQQHCVDPCGPKGTCAPGLACVDGGCTPDQTPMFTCDADGAQGSCQPGSICLRHSCYIACDPGAADACKSADAFNVCKPVTTGSGTYDVCGSADTLGTECDPTQNKACAGSLVCIDGYCR